MSLTKRDLRLLRTILTDHLASGPPEEVQPTKWIIGKIEALLKLKAPKNYWMTYDYQSGQWCVSESTFKVVRPDSKIIHVQVVGTEQVGQT